VIDGGSLLGIHGNIAHAICVVWPDKYSLLSMCFFCSSTPFIALPWWVSHILHSIQLPCSIVCLFSSTLIVINLVVWIAYFYWRHLTSLRFLDSFIVLRYFHTNLACFAGQCGPLQPFRKYQYNVAVGGPFFVVRNLFTYIFVCTLSSILYLPIINLMLVRFQP